MTGSNTGLEGKVQTAITMYVENVADSLIAKGNLSDVRGLRHIINNEYAKVIQHKDNRVARNLLNGPQYALAVSAIHDKTTELAPSFLTEYRRYMNEQSWLVRRLKLRAVRTSVRYGLGFLALDLAYVASKNLVLGTAFGLAVFVAVGYITGGILALADRKANQERNIFEDAIKAEFYRVAGRS